MTCFFETLPFLLDLEDKSENGRESLGTSDYNDFHKYYLRSVMYFAGRFPLLHYHNTRRKGFGEE